MTTLAADQEQTSLLAWYFMDTIKIEIKPAGLKMDTDRETFALALKTWRLRNALTQRAVARRWGISRYTIIRAEAADNISWEMAYRMFARLTEELIKEAK